jgi:hypothetical protein
VNTPTVLCDILQKEQPTVPKSLAPYSLKALSHSLFLSSVINVPIAALSDSELTCWLSTMKGDEHSVLSHLPPRPYIHISSNSNVSKYDLWLYYGGKLGTI